MGTMGCPRCGRTIYYRERVVDRVPFCFVCAQTLGVVRLVDGDRLKMIRSIAAKRPSWWQWTTWLNAAIAISHLWGKHSSPA